MMNAECECAVVNEERRAGCAQKPVPPAAFIIHYTSPELQ
jgi:hypothetical protein